MQISYYDKIYEVVFCYFQIAFPQKYIFFELWLIPILAPPVAFSILHIEIFFREPQ